MSNKKVTWKKPEQKEVINLSDYDYLKLFGILYNNPNDTLQLLKTWKHKYYDHNQDFFERLLKAIDYEHVFIEKGNYKELNSRNSEKIIKIKEITFEYITKQIPRFDAFEDRTEEQNKIMNTDNNHIFNELMKADNPERMLNEFKEIGHQFITEYFIRVIDTFIHNQIKSIDELAKAFPKSKFEEHQMRYEDYSKSYKEKIKKANRIKMLFEQPSLVKEKNENENSDENLFKWLGNQEQLIDLFKKLSVDFIDISNDFESEKKIFGDVLSNFMPIKWKLFGNNGNYALKPIFDLIYLLSKHNLINDEIHHKLVAELNNREMKETLRKKVSEFLNKCFCRPDGSDLNFKPHQNIETFTTIGKKIFKHSNYYNKIDEIIKSIKV